MKRSIWAPFCRVLVLTLARVVFTGNAEELESTDGLTAKQILEKMATIYATCQSYRDSGAVTNFFNPDHIEVVY